MVSVRLNSSDAIEPLLKANQVAKVLSSTPRHVVRLITAGKLRGVRLGLGNSRQEWRVDPMDLAAYIEAQKTPRTESLPPRSTGAVGTQPPAPVPVHPSRVPTGAHDEPEGKAAKSLTRDGNSRPVAATPASRKAKAAGAAGARVGRGNQEMA